MRPFVSLAVLTTLAAGRRDLQAFSDTLFILESARQLPRIAPEKFVEVFALSATVVVRDSLFSPDVDVRLEHYALLFRPHDVSFKTARKGDGVATVHALPRDARAAAGLPAFSGENGTGAALWPDAAAEVLVGRDYDPEDWDAAEYVGAVSGLAFSRLAAQVPDYVQKRPFYAPISVYGAPAADSGAFVQWCLLRLAEGGGLLTPLVKLRPRRTFALASASSPTLVSGDRGLDAWAEGLRACVLAAAPGDAALAALAASEAAPLSRCLKIQGGAAWLRTAGGRTQTAELEAPWCSYAAADPATPEPFGTRDEAEPYDSLAIDVMLLLAIIAGALVGLYLATAKAGCWHSDRAVVRILRRASNRARGSPDGDELYERLTRSGSRSGLELGPSTPDRQPTRAEVLSEARRCAEEAKEADLV